MSPLNPDLAQQLAQQRLAARRALAQGRRWYLRGVILFLITAAAVYRGGQVNVAIGVAMAILAVLSISMGRGMRRSAREAEAKIATMEGSSRLTADGSQERLP
jgi:predicted Na+-dependent transporter